MARSDINNIICDNILRVIAAKKNITRTAMRDAGIYSGIDAEWEVVERHVDFLIRARTLKEEDDILSLTSKGSFMLANAEKIGYVAQKIESMQWQRTERNARKLILIAALLTIGMVIAWVATA